MTYKQYSDIGIILKKSIYKDNLMRLSIFTKQNGKLTVWAYGIKKITSRRISHLETGNYIRFSAHKNKDRFTLGETEIISAFSKIKHNFEKLKSLFISLLVLERILPETIEEKKLFDMTLRFLTDLSNNNENISSIRDNFLQIILLNLGYIDDKITKKEDFNLAAFIEDIIRVDIDKIFT